MLLCPRVNKSLGGCLNRLKKETTGKGSLRQIGLSGKKGRSFNLDRIWEGLGF